MAVPIHSTSIVYRLTVYHASYIAALRGMEALRPTKGNDPKVSGVSNDTRCARAEPHKYDDDNDEDEDDSTSKHRYSTVYDSQTHPTPSDPFLSPRFPIFISLSLSLTHTHARAVEENESGRGGGTEVGVGGEEEGGPIRYVLIKYVVN